jgi:glycosyltransferase involved in cell wall biosynthesis
MTIEAYVLAFNEEATIALTIKHYQQFCDRIIIFDNFSTDSTREIAESLGCEIRPFGIAGVLDDKEYLKVKNNCWKGSNADWVIVCDADEILWHKDLRMLLFDEPNGTIFRTEGWNVFSNDMPANNWLEITTGLPDRKYSKQIIFDPKAIKEIGYVYGCHENNPKGEVIYSQETLTLFHYKHVGGANRVADRHALYAERLSDWNKRYRCGFQYLEPRNKTIEYFNQHLAKSVKFEYAKNN